MNQLATIIRLQQLADGNDGTEVMWLYGSRVKGTATNRSDYDLAIALRNTHNCQQSYYLDELAYQWSLDTQQKITIIDINHIPTPLAYNVISEGDVIICKNSFRLHVEQARIWSLWEAYKYEYTKSRT
ncbi:type VII toxin-antitoxin system MntA family adenylyltransferase antitoxin [Marinomonas sp.]|uniref:type VII toxin-antitoxin system MntA family adenylyltransferase antitoxin n=1 Tax=Marinomonas sp. TaxID=1904862 RepID=UPI003BAD89D9